MARKFRRPSPIADGPRAPIDLANTVARIPYPAQHWASLIFEGNPRTVTHLLRDAVHGYIEPYLTLAELMEERYLHYAAVLQTRKLAVTGEALEVLPGNKTSRAQAIADDFKEYVVDEPNFQGMLQDLMDAIAKGFSVVQPYWDTSTRPWTFELFEHCDPRLFVYDIATMRELRMRAPVDPSGIEIPSGQFIIHQPKIRTGIPIRAGIARAAAVGYMFHSADIRQWAAFAEVFGMPLRKGSYDPLTATQQEIDELKTAVINLGHDAAAVLPNTMDISILDGRRPTSGDNVFKDIADYWDAQISKLVLGQTMTSDNGSSKSQAEVHDRVRVDISRADARSLCATVREQVIEPWTRFNYGEDAPVPRLYINVDPPEDLLRWSQALVPMITAGLPIRWSEVRERFKLSEPQPGDEVSQGKAAGKPGQPFGGASAPDSAGGTKTET